VTLVAPSLHDLEHLLPRFPATIGQRDAQLLVEAVLDALHVLGPAWPATRHG